MGPVVSLTDLEKSRSTLAGSVERVTFFNQDTGECALEVASADLKKSILITTRTPWVYKGMLFTSTIIPQMQSELLQAENFVLTYPQSETNIRRFLRSDAIPNIGPKLSRILAKAFPTDFFTVLEEDPEKLLTVSGIGKKRMLQILESWKEHQAKTEFQSYLFKENLPLSWSQKLWLTHGKQSFTFFKTFPYQASSMHDLLFEAVDRYALEHGFSLDDHERLKAGLHYVIRGHYKEGHCAYPEEFVIQESMELLEVSKSRLEEILEMEIVAGKIVTDTIQKTACLYLKEIWNYEQYVARKLISFQFKAPSWGDVNTSKLLHWAQNILQIDLAPLQKEAIELALSSSLTIITGGPGTGKTTLIRSLVTILQTQFAKFALCSPTGRAAQRLGEATSMPARTIHRLLKFDGLTGKFLHNKNNPLDVDLVLVDEASMIDMALMADLLDALPEHCSLILVGDADQIPSVGAGNVLHSLISSPFFQVVRLQDIYRQSHQSMIKENAKRINTGLMPIHKPNEWNDFHYIPVNNPSEAKQVLLNVVNSIIPYKCGIKNLDEFQILVPLNKGPLGTKQLNDLLQADIERKRNTPPSLKIPGMSHNFKAGDKVMAIQNNYQKFIFNGDIGFIERLDYEERCFYILFYDRSVRFDFHEMDQITLAYAISIHKSQGSEYRAVVVLITEDHLPMAQRHLIYTAVTRGKEHVFLIAQPRALQKAILEVERRWEKLTEMLQPVWDKPQK